MSDAVESPRVRGALGLGSLAVGAVVLVGALAGPAGAHDGKEEPKPMPGGSSCPELAEEFEVDQVWQQFTIDDVADGDFTETYPIDGYDDETVTITVKQGKTFEWESTLGIDAIYVQGHDTEMADNSYFYLYAPEAESEEAYGDTDVGTPPWQEWDTNKIKSISFCYDEQPPSSSSTSSSSTTEAPTTSSSVPESTSSSSIDLNTSTTLLDTTTTAAIDLSVDTTLPPTTAVVAANTLPRTGSNSTGLLVALGAVLVLGGGALLATTRLARDRGD